MKAISKKLLSLLVVIAMVLSMVPFGGLSIFAVETKAAETDTQSTETTYVNPGQQAKEDAAVITAAANALDPTTATSCPVCKATDITWTALGNSNNVAAGGHYYLADDLSITGGINWINVNNTNIANGDTFCVHLNGKNAVVGGRVFINKTVTANFMGTGSITSTSMHTYNSGTTDAPVYANTGLFQMTTSATLNLYGGTYTTTNERAVTAPTNTGSYYATISPNAAGATVNIYDGVTLSVDPAGENKGTNIAAGRAAIINMYGGTITGGNGYPYHTKETATSTAATYGVAGGNVYLRGGATFNMYYGTISGGEAENGGNISVYQTAVFNQYGGKIEDGTATGLYGGNIALGVEPSGAYVADTTYGGTFNQYAGEVTGGYSATNGGNIALRAGYLTVSGTVSNGTVNTETAAGWGGNIYTYTGGGSIVIDGAQLLQTGTTPQACYGGNFASGNSIPSITIQNSVISGGVSARGGNLDFGNAKTVTIENCQITGGKTAATTKVAQAHGGNIYSQNTATVITITDSQISDGKAEEKYGGNIYCTKSEVNLEGSTTVSGGTADQGGNICLTGASGDPGTLTMSGGTVSGGTATYGDDLRINEYGEVEMTGGEIVGEVWAANAVGNNAPDRGKLTVSGTAKIGYVRSDGSGIILFDGGLTEGASIGYYNLNKNFVQYADEATATAAKDFYKASQSGYGVVVNADGTLMIGEVVNEPVVGVFDPENCDGMAYCPVCYANGTHTEPVEWTALTSSDSADASAYAIKNQHVYLAGDLTDARNVTINLYSSGTDALTGCFNLNGHILSMAGRVSVASADETLNIMDTAGGGVLESTGANKANNALYAHTLAAMNGGKIVLHGGTFKNTESVASGVAYLNSSSTYGNASLTVKEGVKLDASGAKYGVIQNNSSTSLVMTGGEITGNVEIKGSLTLSGAPTIGKETTGLVLADGVLADVSGLTEGASIVVTEAEGTVISSACNSPEDAARIAGYFTVDGEGLTVAANSDNQLYVATAVETPVPGDFRPWACGGKAYCPVCGTLETWKDFNSYAYTDVKGHYYLNDHLTKGNANQPVYVSTNNTGCFNLNGYTLSIDGRIAVTAANSTLNVMDTSEGKTGAVESTGTRKSENALYGHTVVAQGGGSIVLHGGTFKNTDSTSSVVYVNNASSSITIGAGAKIDATGAMYGVNVNNGSVILDGGTIEGASSNTAVVRVASGKTFTMNSGTIDGKNVTRSVETVGTVTMNGGTIQNGTSAEAMGGNIYVTGGSFTMNNGFIKDGKAMNFGGNIAINAAVTVTVKGGEISGGTITGTAANNGGGNIAVRTTGAILDIQGGEIKDGTVNFDITSHAGGNIHMGGGTVKISGGTISGGKSASNTAGGSIYMTGGSLLQMTAGTITGGENTNTGGGNIGVWNGTVEIGGTAQVLDGIAKSAGGNIYICKNTSADNKLTITGGEISGGDAITNGGNIFIGATEELEMTGGTVSSGTAATNSDSYGGGNIYSDGNVTMSGGEIHSGTAVKGPGGNVVIANADMEMSGDAKIYDGTAEAHQGGNVRVYKGKLTMSDDAKIYGGHSGSSSKSHNVWIVAGDMEMSGNSYVYGKEQANGNAISIAPYGSTSATLTLKDNAKVMNDPADPVVSKGSINLGYTACNDDDLTNDMHANIVIDDSWTGEAYIMMFKSTGALNDAGTATKMAWLNIGDTVDGGDGSVNGPVGTGTSFTGNLYYTARTYYTGIIGSDSGKLVLAGHAVVDTTNDTEQWMSMEDAVAAANGNETKYLKAVDDVTLSGETVYIDALKAINVTGTGTAYGIDPANADFTTASTGSLSGEIVESDATFDGVRYIKIADGSVHAIEMGITGVSLRPTAVGLYYKATYKCDAALAEAIDAYGVVLSVNDMPGADFADVATDQFTVREDFSDLYAAATVANTVTANSGSVFGIMKDRKSVEDNAKHGVMKIYANAYILVDGAAIYVADTENCGKEAGVALSLFDVMDKVDQKWNELNLSDTNIQQINALFDKCVAWGEVDWTFTNIKGTNA